jgi:hypothetical protein
MVRTGADRRETGTHYTPKSLTEMIVKNTPEPLVYGGPAAGKPREEWALKSAAELLDLKICDLAMGSGAFLVQVCRWLSERLVEAWAQAEVLGKAITSHGEIVDEIGSREPLRRDVEERLLTAKRLIAERCIYGVDMNPLAVELAKLSIWLITLAKGRPFGFLDHNLRRGDSLLGITTLEQLHSLELNPAPHLLKKLFARDIDKAVNEAIRLRLDLRSRPVNDIRDVEEMADLDQSARAQLELPSLAADALVGEFLATDGGATDTTVLSIEVGEALKAERSSIDHLRSRSISGLKTDLPPQRMPRHPFHWPLEFPEVFLRDQGGFDAIVGNPPFLGGQRITGAMGTAYRSFLVGCIAKGVRGSADLIAYFFLRAFDLLRNGGNFGLLAVNTVAEGDTRQVGLERLIREFGATIHAAFPNEPWPGKAAVVTSRVHIRRGDWKGDSILSGRRVPFISAFLSDQEEWSPKGLKANAGKCFQGSIALGMGFVITEDQATGMIERDPNNREVLYPYLNGKDLNSHPEQKPSRWAINFWDWPEEKAQEYDEPYRIVLEKVQPERQRRKANGEFQLEDPLPQRWWQYKRRCPALYHAIGRGHNFIEHPEGWNSNQLPMDRVLGITRVSKYLNVAFLENSQVFTLDIFVFALNSFQDFALLSSNIHEVWTRKQASTQETRLRYTATDCYETLPYPNSLSASLGDLGKAYEQLRRTVMLDQGIGLTKLYNQFHDRSDKAETLLALRELHRQIDQDVAIAYGWDDIDLGHDFHEVDYLPEGDRVRFTISEATRIEVVRRLSKLNKDRFAAQPQSNSTTKPANSNGASIKDDEPEDDLFATKDGKA